MISLAHAITTTPAVRRISFITQSILRISIPRYYGESTTASNLFEACSFDAGEELVLVHILFSSLNSFSPFWPHKIP